jgi:hypothetical protein
LACLARILAFTALFGACKPPAPPPLATIGKDGIGQTGELRNLLGSDHPQGSASASGTAVTLSSLLSPQDLAAELNLTTEFPTTADIQGTKPLVAAYITPPYGPAPDVLKDLAGSDQIKAYLQTLVNQLIGAPALAPGRTFAVKIQDTQQNNANMDMYQTMRIYRGMFQDSTAAYLLGTLCHEMTHSARNHGIKLGATYEHFLDPSQPAVAAYRQRLADFEARYLNESTNTYTHNAAAFQDLLAAYMPVMSTPLMHSRRHESEADIIGGIICAMNGMPSAAYIQTYYEDVVSDQLNPQVGPGGAQLKDGDQIQINDADMDDFVENVLLMDPAHSTHPTPEQRYNQLQQFKSLIDQFYDPNGPLAAPAPVQTVRAFAGTLPASASSALALAGLPPPTSVRLVRVVKADGSVLFLHKGHACTGQD